MPSTPIDRTLTNVEQEEEQDSELFTVLAAPEEKTVASQDLPQTDAKHFLILRSNGSDNIISLEDTTYSIGRHHANAIAIADVRVSRQHALLLRIPRPKSSDCFYRIIDGNLQGKRSQNGILVNGTRCYSHDLHSNDVIRFSPEATATYYQAGNSHGQPSTGPHPSPREDQSHISEAALIRLSSIPELTPHPIIEMEPDGTLIYLNASARKHFPNIDNPYHPVRQQLEEIITAKTQTYYEVREIKVKQHIYEQSIHWLPQSNLIRCHCSEITERRQMEEAVRHSEERFALAARGANDGLWDWDIAQDTLFLSPRWKAMIGYGELELQPNIQEWIDRIHPDNQYQFRRAIYEHLKGKTPHLECEYQLRHKQGHYLYFRCRGIAVFNEEGEAERMAGSMTDITAYHKAQEKALHDAFHDAMTGLANRLLLKDRLIQALQEFHRNSERRFALFFLDLDRFKIINDSLGHSAGDQLLIEVSQRLLNTMRQVDVVARLGGDEFVVLAKDVKDINGAAKTAMRLGEALRQNYHLDGHNVCTSASIGIVMADERYHSPEELLRDADMAMYQAKRHGKDNYAVFDSSFHDQAIKILEIENSLRLAIENQDFELYYQPIINLETHVIESFEALIRWCDPSRGIVSPADFIPLAEDTGLIIPLGNWVIRAAFQQLKEWHQTPETSSLSICINIAGQQFSHPEFIDVLKSALEETSIDPGYIEIEITEGSIMHKEELVIKKLHELKEIGFKLSIDDFGTGYSSLSYLQHFPIDTLKVDRSFISEMNNRNSYEIVKTIVALAHNLNMEVVAEGVEDAQQVERMKALNCKYAQGYYFSRPVNAATAPELLFEESISQIQLLPSQLDT